MLSKPTLLATLATLTTLTAAQTPPNCTVSYQGDLGLRHSSDYAHGPITYTNTIPGIQTRGLDGHSDPFLVTQYKNGTAVAPSTLWEFLTCSSLQPHGYPPGYTTPQSGPVNLAYGILRRAGKTNECLSLGSKVDDKKGAKNRLVVARECAKVEERYRSFMIENYIYGETSYGMRLFYLYADDQALVANTTHKQVELVTQDTAGDPEAKQLLLLQRL